MQPKACLLYTSFSSVLVLLESQETDNALVTTEVYFQFLNDSRFCIELNQLCLLYTSHCILRTGHGSA